MGFFDLFMPKESRTGRSKGGHNGGSAGARAFGRKGVRPWYT